MVYEEQPSSSSKGFTDKVTAAASRVREKLSDSDKRGIDAIVGAVKDVGHRLEREGLNSGSGSERIRKLSSFVGVQLETLGRKMQASNSDKRDVIDAEIIEDTDKPQGTYGK